MFLFNRKKKPIKGHYHHKTDDQIEREQARKEKSWAREKLLEKAKTNPELENQYISKLMGIEINPPDPAEEHKREIRKIISQEALEEIKRDPELRKEFARSHVEEIIGESHTSREFGDGEFFGSPIAQALQELENLDALKERIGGKSGPLGGLITAEVISEGLKTIRELKGKVERVYIVQINGKSYEVPESQYQQYLQQGRIAPIAALQEPKAVKIGPPAEPPISEPAISAGEPELPEFFSMVDLGQLAGYLDQPPEEFVIQLETEVSEGITQSQLIWNFLTTTSHDKIVELITPYKNHSQVGVYVERLLSGKAWLEEVLRLIKERTSAG